MYINFEKMMQKAKIKFERNPETTRYINQDIALALMFIRQKKQEYPDLSESKFKMKIIKDLYKMSEEYIQASTLMTELFEYEAARTLAKDPKLIEQFYKQIEDSDEEIVKKGEIYTSNKEKACSFLVRKVVSELREKVECRNAQEELNYVKYILKKFEKEAEKELKGKYVNTLCLMSDFFKRFDLLERYTNLTMNQFKQMGLSSIAKLFKDSDNKPVVEAMFEKENLEKMSTEDLGVLVAFWINRYGKENSSLKNGIFTIDTLELWDKINENSNIEISKEQAKAVFCKEEFLEKCIQRIISDRLEEIEASNDGRDNVYVELAIQPEIDEIEDQVGLRYYQEFEGIIPTSYSKLANDFDIYTPFVTCTLNPYIDKRTLIASQIYSLMNSKKVRNWGFIREKMPKDNMILVGIDYEGFNMPLRLHIPKNDIVEYLETNNQDTIIPIYEGDRDFTVYNTPITTQILMPFTREQKAEIREIDKEKRPRVCNFIEHLLFLTNQDKYPDHLKVERVIKGKKMRARPNRKYINLATGDLLEKDEKGNMFITGKERRFIEDDNGSR